MEEPRPDRPLLVLVDGHSLLHRAFYALPPLTSDEGHPTNAVHGFFNMLFRLLKERNPKYLAVALDAPGPTFRHQVYREYKAHRPSMPDDLRPQVPLLKELLEAMNICAFEVEGFEADDILGSMAKEARKAGLSVLIVTGDRDALQLVKPGVDALLMRKGISDFSYFDREAIRTQYRLEPHRLLDVKALMGDSSDNIPGIPGVGEKTALSLVQQFGPVEKVLESTHLVKGKKLPQLLNEYRDQALLSKDLARIDEDMPLKLVPEELVLEMPEASELREVFLRYGLKSLLERLPTPSPGHVGVTYSEVGSETLVVETADDLARSVTELEESLRGGRQLGLWAMIEDSGIQGVGLSVGQDHSWLWLAGNGEEGRLGEDALSEALARILSSATRIASHDFKSLASRLALSGTIDPADLRELLERSLWFDTSLAAYLLDPSRTDYSLSGLSRQYLDIDLASQQEFFGKGKRARSPRELPRQQLRQFFGGRAEVLLQLPEQMEAELEAKGLAALYREVELPLVSVLVRMEARGVGVDLEVLREMGGKIRDKVDQLEKEIFQLAQREINLNSPQQLAQVLFDELGLEPVKKTKTGYSTDAEVLEALSAHHPVPRMILEYRSLVKLLGTYVEGLESQVSPVTGRIHTTFNQTVAATGRLSATEPNLQNIPIREETGRLLRKAFIADEDYLLVSADYSQIELRIMAHLSEDEGLIEAFQRDLDIHTATAREVFGVEEVSPAMRDAAKAVNFGIIYGISAFGLGRNLRIPQSEADDYIKTYFQRYPGVKRYMKESVARARERGYTTTLYGRVRYLPDLNSRNWQRRSLAERMAINTPIQGTAADIIKKAMVEVQRNLDRSGLDAWLLLQVHDELILEVAQGHVAQAMELVRKAMEDIAQLRVPLKVDTGQGRSWYEVKAG